MTYMMGYRGDYMGGYRGDPGLFGTIFGGIRKVAGVVGTVLPGPVGIAARGISRLGRKQAPAPVSRYLPPPPMPVQRTPGIAGRIARLMPGGKTGYQVQPDGTVRRAYRRMNVANPKALRRAIRRQAGFVKLARKALRGTGYTIVSKGSRRPSPARINVSERGPGGVVVRG